MRVTHILVALRHFLRSDGCLAQMPVVFGEELQLVLEEVIHIPNSGAQQDLVCGLAQGLDKSTKDCHLLARLGAQILVVLEKYLQMLVDAKDRMAGQAAQEHLVHGHRLLEGGQVLAGK